MAKNIIVVRFSTTRGPISWLIRTFTFSKWSHVDIIFPEKDMIGAKFLYGVHIHDTRYIQYKDYYIELEKHEHKNDFYMFLHSQLGKSYDLGAIFGMFLRRSWMHDENKWFCSELVAAAAEHIGIQLVNASANRVTPGDLLKSILVKEL